MRVGWNLAREIQIEILSLPRAFNNQVWPSTLKIGLWVLPIGLLSWEGVQASSPWVSPLHLSKAFPSLIIRTVTPVSRTITHTPYHIQFCACIYTHTKQKSQVIKLVWEEEVVEGDLDMFTMPKSPWCEWGICYSLYFFQLLPFYLFYLCILLFFDHPKFVWDLNSPIRDETAPPNPTLPTLDVWSPNHWRLF